MAETTPQVALKWDRLDWTLYGLWTARCNRSTTNHEEIAFLRSIYQMGFDDAKNQKEK